MAMTGSLGTSEGNLGKNWGVLYNYSGSSENRLAETLGSDNEVLEKYWRNTGDPCGAVGHFSTLVAKYEGWSGAVITFVVHVFFARLM